jgi:hypothetical protein
MPIGIAEQHDVANAIVATILKVREEGREAS